MPPRIVAGRWDQERRVLDIIIDSSNYAIPLSSLEGADGTEVTAAQVVFGGDALEVTQASGASFYLPWDLVLHLAEPTYSHYKGSAQERLAREREGEQAGRIALRIREERLRRGWTVAELARRAGMQRPNLSRLERGRQHSANLDTLERVARALDVPVVSLLTPPVAPAVRGVRFSAARMHVALEDGREISVPLGWFPRLERASAEQRQGWSLTAGGTGIRWEELDEDISVRSLIAC